MIEKVKNIYNAYKHERRKFGEMFFVFYQFKIPNPHIFVLSVFKDQTTHIQKEMYHVLVSRSST